MSIRRGLPLPSPRPRRRQGIAVTELAICAPVLLLLSVVLIEFGTLIFFKQGLAVAAYQGAHHGVRPAATADDIRRAATQVLEDRRITGGSINVSPGDILSIPAGELFTVTVSAPSGSNSLAIFGFFKSRQITSQVTVMKETEAQ